MDKQSDYYVVKKHALPEVLLKVVEMKKLIESGKVSSVQEGADLLGISRSSFYKYKDDIFPFHDSAEGTTITLTFQMDDEPGLLSEVLKAVADFGGNILTIHQSIPISGVATLTLSIQILESTGDVSEMVGEIENKRGVRFVQIVGRES